MTRRPLQSSCFAFIARHKFPWLILVCFFGIVADQASKQWARHSLAAPYQITEEVIYDGEVNIIARDVFYPVRTLVVIPGLFNFIYKENPAAAFSLTRSIPSSFRIPLLICISVIAIIFFLFWYIRMRPSDGLLLASASLIIAGALGNLIDRFHYGYVIDFIDIYAGFLGHPHSHWPTFNIADTLIVIGAIGVIIRTIWPAQGLALEKTRLKAKK